MGRPPAKAGTPAVNFQGRQLREAGISPHPPPVGGASFLPGGATQVDWDHSLTVFLSAHTQEALTTSSGLVFVWPFSCR